MGYMITTQMFIFHSFFVLGDIRNIPDYSKEP